MNKLVREALATAASSIPGIKCLPYFVQSTEPGAAMIRLDRIEYPNPFGGVCYWNVIIMLPQDQAAAESFLDQKIPAIREAIAEHIVVTQIRPERLDLPGVGVLPCVFINGHREQE